MNKKNFSVNNKRAICESGKFRIIAQDAEFSDGHKEVWEYVETKGRGARILAITDDNRLILVREYRSAADKYVLRIPTGEVRADETPEEAARRELQEETGYRAKQVEYLGEQSLTSAYFKTATYLFLARGLELLSTNRDHGERDMIVLTPTLQEAYKMVENLEIEDPNVIYAILLLKNHLKEKVRGD